MVSKRGSFDIGLESMKMFFYVFFVLIVVLAVVYTIGSYTSRDVKSKNLEFFIEKEKFLHEYFDGGASSESLNNLSDYGARNANLGIFVQAGDDKYYSNKEVYNEKGFCNIRGSKHVCMDLPYADVLLIDGRLKTVKINMVIVNE